ncbi:tetratricopeptide repeat protein [Patescibacteria group bacterium]|nr:tetratricopeptide repeat protein [Patescibacteria group bacterium]MCL5091574.1 tetratricopeptide repeat protein [Patescibacteria group bacterium]
MRRSRFVLALVIIGFLVYFPSLFGQFIWDDEDFITSNRYVHAMQVGKFFTENAIAGRGKSSDYYRPLQLTINALLYQIGGNTPWIYHLSSVLLHLGAAVCVYYLLLFILPGLPEVAWTGAVFFLVHPVQTEVVSYASGISDSLLVIFSCLALLAGLTRPTAIKSFAAAVIFFVLALLSKETGLLVIGLAVLIVAFSWSSQRRRRLPVIAAWTIIGLIYWWLRHTLFQFGDIARDWGNNPYAHRVMIRLATFAHSFFTYLSILIFPKDLFMERDMSITIAQSPLNLWVGLFIVTNAVILWLSRSRQLRLLWLAFILTLAPYTGIVLINGVFYEHFLYFPLVFFWAFVLTTLRRWLKHPAFITALTILIVALTVRSYLRQSDWIDNLRFYQQTLAHAPTSIRVINNLGMELANRGRFDQAISVYQYGLKLDQRTPQLYHNLANAYQALGKYQLAVQYYQRALRVDPRFSFSRQALDQLYRTQPALRHQ